MAVVPWTFDVDFSAGRDLSQLRRDAEAKESLSDRTTCCGSAVADRAVHLGSDDGCRYALDPAIGKGSS